MDITESWPLIGDNYYIKYHFYNMKWEIVSSNFNDYIFAHETYGGSIAAISKSPSHQELMVFTPSGILLSNLVWKDAPVIGLHWSENENIFLLQKSGRVAIYTLLCQYVKYVGMGDSVKEHNVKSFRFFISLQGTGLMILTEYNELFYKTNLLNSDSHIRLIQYSRQCRFDDPIIDWIAFTDLAFKETVAVFISGHSLIRLKHDEEPVVFGSGLNWFSSVAAIVRVALAMSELKLALLRTDSTLWIVPTNLGKSLASCQFEFEWRDGDNIQMEWAGEDLVLIYHQDHLYLMDTDSQYTSCMYLYEPLIFPEIDGARLISATRHDFLQKVPPSLEQLSKITSESPAMLLLDAQQHLINRSSDAVNCLELIMSQPDGMAKAIDTCLEAAASCLEPKWQKIILCAVRLGRSYIPEYKSDKVQDVHKKLLLLNNLKLPFIAMPVTMNELEKMTMDVLLDRLINRRYYPFVERICSQLRVPKSQGINRMLEHWADNQIERHDDEYILAAKIIGRLENHPDFDFAKIASRACDLAKETLAEKLLDREGRIQHQVRILLKLKKNSVALQRAIESGDSDLISWVVSDLYSRLSQQDFVMMIHRNPIAKTMYLENLLDSNNVEATRSRRSLDDMDDNLARRTECQLKKMLSSETLQAALSSINVVQDLYKKAGNDFMNQVMDDEKVLLQNMSTTLKGAEPELTNGCLSLPIHDYLAFLFQNRLYEKAESFRQKLKISDRQFYWTKLNVCAKTGNWDEFNATVAKWSRKPLVSYYDIGEICADYNHEAQLLRYMDKIELEKRVCLLVKINKLQEAEELARLIKNEYLINYVTALKF